MPVVGRSSRKRRFRRRELIAAATLIAGWRARAGFAQSGLPDDAPAAPILRLRSGLLALARASWPPSPAELRPLVAETFDLPDITAAVLGAAAASATSEQITRFAQAFGQRMVRELARNRPEPDTDRFAIQETRPIAPGEWLVLTYGELPGGKPVVVSWRVRALPEGLRVVDVLRDGVSAVQVQHDDIATALRARPMDELLADIERRAAR